MNFALAFVAQTWPPQAAGKQPIHTLERFSE
jgi:hypothetical protein